ncbi:MAG: xanthine dehydrogenase accessory protein XdhC [Acidiferrobacterales bacterium]|nr:xanthine dehydrogenase accessory protein XdhC [Acidiferrobacterales bacterium]
MSWTREFVSLAQRTEPFVAVTVIEVIGSAPREIGARMLVTDSGEYESIGGGNLEYNAIRRAREILQCTSDSLRETKMFGLGVEMHQCCGGAVRLLFEKPSPEEVASCAREFESQNSRTIKYLVTPLHDETPSIVLNNKSDYDQVPELFGHATDSLLRAAVPNACVVGDGISEWLVTRLDDLPTNVVVFGAGHVGKALIRLLGDLPFRIEWVDQRSDMFPLTVPDNVAVIDQVDLKEILMNQEPGTFYAVMTHSHGLDYEICLEILKQRDFGWLGLIGSSTKRRRFDKRFVADGIDPFTLRRLECPIGVAAIKGKHPAVIAMSTAAKLLEERQRVLDVEFSDRTASPRNLDSTAS